MTLPPIQLDTRDFEALVSEARQLIPRLAPLWTDHNPSDPGITLVELLAWLADQQLYRVGHVGEPHRRAFAALLGQRPAPPRPARGLIWPDAPVRRGHLLRAGTAVLPIGQPQVGCVVEQEVFLSPAIQTQAAAQVDGGRVDLRASFRAPRASFAFTTPGDAPAGQRIELGFDRPLVQEPAGDAAAATVTLGIEVPGRPVVPPEPQAPPPWGPLRFDYRIGSGPYLPAETVFDGTFALSVTGVVLLRLPAAAAAMPSILRLRLDLGYFPVAPEISRMTLNVLPVRQAQPVPTADIGTGSGLPDQVIDLAEMRDADLAAPFQVQTEERGRLIDWQMTDDVSRHGPADRVCRLQPRRRRLLFGNGVNGLVPAAGLPILRAGFERTDGRRGNLAAGLQWRIEGIAGEGAFGRNPAPIAGGEDATDAPQLAADARARARRRSVLLSDDDLRSAAMALPGYAVGRAEVIRSFYPHLPRRVTRGTRTLVVMPWRRTGLGPQQAPLPAPAAVSPGYSRAVARALEARRLIGERLSVISARPVRIRVEASLLVAADDDPRAVISSAAQALNARLTDIPVVSERSSSGGGSPVGGAPASPPWPLGRPVTLTEMETVLAGVPGVHAVLGCRLAWEDQPFAIVDVVLAQDEVAVGGVHAISARRETDG